jgi:glycosidase
MTFAFHISREARERYDVESDLFTLTGNAVLPDFGAGRRLAQRMNARDGRGLDPARAVHAGELNAMGLLDEILHAVVAEYRTQVNPLAMRAALGFVEDRVGVASLAASLEAFADRFPTAQAAADGQTAAAYLEGTTDGVANREIALEELLMLWLSNANPALAPFEELFDDAPLVADTRYADVIAALIAFFGTQPPFGPDGQTLIELLRAPASAVPDSIAGQLRFVRERWLAILERFGDRLVTQLDVLAEEERAIWQRFHPGFGGGRGSPAEEAARRAGRAWLTEAGWAGGSSGSDGAGGPDAEPERFSLDRDWMPRLVLIAKSSFVWLDQLSRRYGRAITRLDEIPDEELDQLARWGFTGLWLIGLWQRSRASQTIKQLRGNPEAVASAYSLDDYRIADDLGGEEAFERLKARAWTRGIRIASDMVPNHMGVDSRWVIDHPDWFMALPEPPYPAYAFTGPDLSADPRVGIQIEDHYFDNTDAAVVFKRWDRETGAATYVYHGNDGTSMPWNDTAQLDYLKPEVREAVIQTILGVARRSPVIRFDAAMTLAKRHIERLWYPEPGHGGAIPSRAEHALPKAAFEQAMPLEFWREVVDRVATEVPDTLLLAEAFWLMEGYFVRTLGMHRVYNSAFMNMLRDEQNAQYRSVIKNTIEFDPEVLKRYVNFMNNPDEKTAVEQFGKGDKYFGIATLMATLPGLPMFGHGQVEGFTEKYGMEYRRAYSDEQPDSWLIERHEREIAPLLQRRRLFADVDDFLLYDFLRDNGTVDEDVYAYSNRGGGEASLVVYNNRFEGTSGVIRESAPYSARVGEGRETRRRTVAEGLGLHDEPGWFVALRDARSGMETLQASSAIHADGLPLALDGYGSRVFLDIRELSDPTGRSWTRLAADLDGRAVTSLDDALRDLSLRPIHEPLRRLLEPARLDRLAQAATDAAATDLEADVAAVLEAAGESLAGATPTHDAAAEVADRIVTALRSDRAYLSGGRGSVERSEATDRPTNDDATDRPTNDDAAPTSHDAAPTEHHASPTVQPVAGTDVAAGPMEPVDGRPEEAGPASTPGPDADPSSAPAGQSAASDNSVAPDTSAAPPPDPQQPAAAPAPDRTLIAAWALLHALPGALGLDDDGELVRTWIDEWRLAPTLADAFRQSGLPEAESWRRVEALKALLALPAWELDRPLTARVETILAAWLVEPSLTQVLQINVHRDIRWLNRESFEAFARLAGRVEHLREDRIPNLANAITATVDALIEAAATAGYRLDALVAPPASQSSGA